VTSFSSGICGEIVGRRGKGEIDRISGRDPPLSSLKRREGLSSADPEKGE